jgi:hypothetical protein
VAAAVLGARVGESFHAVVTGVKRTATYVRLTTPPVDGRVVEGEAGLDVGDAVRVRLVDTDVADGFIDFVRVCRLAGAAAARRRSRQPRRQAWPSRARRASDAAGPIDPAAYGSGVPASPSSSRRMSGSIRVPRRLDLVAAREQRGLADHRVQQERLVRRRRGLAERLRVGEVHVHRGRPRSRR